MTPDKKQSPSEDESKPQNQAEPPYVEMERDSSPWTELFQHAQAAKKAAAAKQAAEQSRPASTDSAKSADSTDNDHPTRDALSAIFNGQ